MAALFAGIVLLLWSIATLAARNTASVSVMRLLAARKPSRYQPMATPGCRWMKALDEYVRTGGGAACLQAALLQFSAQERRIRGDQLLVTAAALRSPQRAATALQVTHDAHLDSAVGYVALATALQGDAPSRQLRHEALERAAAADAEGNVQVMRRAQAWYQLGHDAGSRTEALRDYAGALAADPKDTSWGYAWMSAVEIARLHAQVGEWQEASSALKTAAALPDRYGRRAAALLDLAVAECRRGSEPDAAEAIDAGGAALSPYRGRPCPDLISILRGKTDLI
jgi:tetratricopeptide (TPR) repeat protein